VIEIRHIQASISIGLLDLKAFSAQNNLLLKREQEKAGTQFVLRQLFGNNPPELKYTEQNKPYLAGRAEHISISHSHDRLVMIVNREKNTGIDIELIRDKVLAIRHKFLNDREAAFAGSDTETLITIWAAKEAMYKCYGLKQLDFRTHLSVENFDSNVIFGKIETEDFRREFHLIRERIDDYMLVYILNEI
jgi:4'-phosphopantetheinyl transferase